MTGAARLEQLFVKIPEIDLAVVHLKGLWFEDVRLGISKDWTERAGRLRGSECNSKEYEVPVNPRWMVFHEPGDTISYVVVGKPAGGTWRVATSGTTAPNVTASVVDAASEVKDAETPVLEPTQVGAPLTALADNTAGEGDDSGLVPRIVLVLVVLVAGLGLATFNLRPRNRAA